MNNDRNLPLPRIQHRAELRPPTKFLPTPRDSATVNSSPGWSPVCSPRSPCFGQRGFKLLDGGIAHSGTGADASYLVRGRGKFGDVSVKLGM